ncbi:MAG: ribose-phosphate diphosphokinase [Euryarchaeota archaeon]|nr:ribose-phosphate diphosphokinase [Euryarchaeota archaeon]
MIIGGSASQKLAANIAGELGDTLCSIETRKFPDGERYIRIKGKLEDEAVVIQSTGYPQDENLIELFFLLKNLKTLDVNDIKVVIPYFGYGRQDKRFRSGEAVSASIVLDLLQDSGASKIFTINLHENNITEFFDIPVHNLSAMPLIADYIKEILDDPVIIAPDKGALEHAEEIAGILRCEHDYLEKRRISPNEVETKPKNLDVDERQAVIIDDIISTGGTMINASKILKEHGASKIIVACVHPVLVGNSLLKIFATGVVDVVATNTLTSDVSVISVASLIADALRRY